MKPKAKKHHNATDEEMPREDAPAGTADTSAEAAAMPEEAGATAAEEPATGAADAAAEASAAEEAPPAEETPEEEPLRNQLLRLQADFDNYRKRVARDRQEWNALATEGLVKDLLPVLDNFRLGLEKASPDAANGVVEGFRLIFDQLAGALRKAGLETVEPKPGDEFDPTVHEAITQMPSADIEEGRVFAATRAGYRLGNKLLRAAQVVVSAGTP